MCAETMPFDLDAWPLALRLRRARVPVGRESQKLSLGMVADSVTVTASATVSLSLELPSQRPGPSPTQASAQSESAGIQVQVAFKFATIIIVPVTTQWRQCPATASVTVRFTGRLPWPVRAPGLGPSEWDLEEQWSWPSGCAAVRPRAAGRLDEPGSGRRRAAAGRLTPEGRRSRRSSSDSEGDSICKVGI